MLELATQVRDVTSGRDHRESELLITRAEGHINRLTTPVVAARRGLSCVALGGFGWDVEAGRRYELDFDDRAVTLLDLQAPAPRYACFRHDLLAIDIGGPGAQTSGGGFVVGGFGLEGAAQGMLAAGVLSAMTTRTKITTLFSLHAIHGEAFFAHDSLTPHELRIQLSEVIVRVRPAARDAASRADEVA